MIQVLHPEYMILNLEIIKTMTTSRKSILLCVIIIGIGLAFGLAIGRTDAQQIQSVAWVTGSVFDLQSQPVVAAKVALLGGENKEILVETQTQKDGRYTLAIPEEIPDNVFIQIERSHFKNSKLSLSSEIVDSLRLGETLVVPDVQL